MKSKNMQARSRSERPRANNAGFTLVELMIAMVIFSLGIAGVVGAFRDQLRSHNTQQQILAMQQNARAAMYFITSEIRLAGFDPTGNSDAGLAPDAAVRTTTTFSMNTADGANDGIDNNGDGNDDEPTEASDYISYSLNNNQITRTDGTGNVQILADNIEVLDFVYHGINPADPTDTDFRFGTAGAAANPGNLLSVNVTIIARTPVVMAISHKVEDSTEYRNIDGDMVLNKNIAPDNFRRIMLQKTVKLRNMGLS